MNYPIDNDVPAPHSRRYGPFYKYPFPDMKVDDSFYVKGDLKKVSSVRAAACRFAQLQKPKWKFRTQADKTGVRVWRII